MTRLGTSAGTDYKHVDGVETITLRRDTTEVSVAYANRGNVSAGNQLSGMDVGSVVWLLPVAEFTGALTRPYAEDKIVTAADEAFVIVGVPKMNASRMWVCLTRLATIAET